MERDRSIDKQSRLEPAIALLWVEAAYLDPVMVSDCGITNLFNELQEDKQQTMIGAQDVNIIRHESKPRIIVFRTLNTFDCQPLEHDRVFPSLST